MTVKNISNQNNDEVKFQPENPQIPKLECFQKHRNFLGNVLNKVTKRILNRNIKTEYQSRNKRKSKLCNPRNHNLHYAFQPKSNSNVTKEIQNLYQAKNQQKILRNSTNVNFNSNTFQGFPNVIKNISPIFDNYSCRNKSNYRYNKCSKPEFFDTSEAYKKSIQNIRNFFNMYVSENQSESQKLSRSKSNSGNFVNSSSNEVKTSHQSISDKNTSTDRLFRKDRKKPLKNKEVSENIQCRSLTEQNHSSHIQSNSRLTDYQKTIFKSKQKLINSQVNKNESKLKRKRVKCNRKCHRIKPQKVAKNKQQMSKLDCQYSYRILTHRKTNYINDDLINYSLIFHQGLIVFDQFRMEIADMKTFTGFECHLIESNRLVSRKCQIPIIVQFRFDFHQFYVYEYKTKVKSMKFEAYLHVNEQKTFDSVIELNEFQSHNRIKESQTHQDTTYYNLSKINKSKPEIIEKNSLYWNLPFRDSWDEISLTASHSSGTAATKDNKSMNYDQANLTENIYGSDIETDSIADLSNDGDLQLIENKSKTIDSILSEYFQLIIPEEETLNDNSCRYFLDEFQIFDLCDSSEYFTIISEENIKSDADSRELFCVNYRNRFIGSNSLLVQWTLSNIAPISVSERKSMLEIEYCVKFSQNEVTLQDCGTSEMLPTTSPTANYSNYSKLLSSNETAIRCWEMLNGDNHDYYNMIDSQKLVNQLKLLFISEISYSIDKCFYNYKNININNCEQLCQLPIKNVNCQY